jgi:hypothetical protein
MTLASHAGTCELDIHTKIQQVEALAQTLLAFERGLSRALLAVRRAQGCCHRRRIAVLVQAAVSYDMRHPSQAASLLFHKRFDSLFSFGLRPGWRQIRGRRYMQRDKQASKWCAAAVRGASRVYQRRTGFLGGSRS